MERLPLRASARLAAICVTTLCAYFGRSRRTRIEPLSEVNAFQRPTLTTKESITAFESGSYWPSDAWIIGRCDNASYITNGGCMFPGTAGVFHVDYNEPSYKESVKFVYNSMFHLDTVMPDSVGLYVPAGYYRQPLANNSYVPLHRNYYGNRSRTKVVAKCVELYGENCTDRPDGQKNQCDEYPFSASYENANYDDRGTAATWAVKPVLALHNSNSGNALSIFYLYDHILDGHQYYVKIDNPPAA